MTAGARLVGLGESRHDTREQLLVKGRIVRQLIEELDFRALILEESFPHAESLDHYVTSGEGDPRQILNRLAGWYLWDTEEMLELIEWVRQSNERREPDRRVRIFGADVTAPAPGIRTVLDLLERAGTDHPLTPRSLGLDLQQGDLWPDTWERYRALAGDRRGELDRNYTALIELLESERAAIVASSSESDHEHALLLAEIGKFGNDLFSSADRAQGGEIRERGMARTTLWILERELPGQKAVLWAHNLHVAKGSFRMPELAEGALEPMGVRLSEELGDGYIAIGAAFGEGEYPPDLPPGERRFERPAPNVMDGALAEVGRPSFLLDLREAENDPAAADWLSREHEWGVQDARCFLVPSAAFDLVYFVESISRSQPTPLAIPRFQRN